MKNGKSKKSPAAPLPSEISKKTKKRGAVSALVAKARKLIGRAEKTPQPSAKVAGTKAKKKVVARSEKAKAPPKKVKAIEPVKRKTVRASKAKVVVPVAVEMPKPAPAAPPVARLMVSALERPS